MSFCFNQLLEKMHREINAINAQYADSIEIASKSIVVCQHTLTYIRTTILEIEYLSEKEEIHFFKQVKPVVFSKLVYFLNLRLIESKLPSESIRKKTKYLETKVKELQECFEENFSFYMYFLEKKSHLDHQYFVRGKESINLNAGNWLFYMDEDFCTSHDVMLSTFIAYTDLITHLQLEILKWNSSLKYKNKSSNHLQSNLKWTGKKIDAVELIYALHTSGTVNNGKANINEIIQVFEQVFQIEFGDCYRTFTEIRARKINNTKFLDHLKISLQNRIEVLNE